MLLYVLVLIGSLSAILAMLVTRGVIQKRSIRRFVRSVRSRFASVADRGAIIVEETVVERPRRNPRTSAIELQQVRSLLRSAEKAGKQGQADIVEKVLIQALTIHPHSIDVRAELAKLYLTTSRESKAEAMYKELLRDVADVSFFANLGLAYYKQEQYIEACQAYQEALNIEPKNPERSAALGRACIAAKRFAEAAPLLEKATAYLSRNIELLHLLAESYLQIGEREKAEEAYRRINRLEPYDEAVKQRLKSFAEGGQGGGIRTANPIL